MNKTDKWSEKFQKLLNEIPEGYWLFVAEGNIHLMKYDEKGNVTCIPNASYAIDPKAIETSFNMPDHAHVDGGDW